MLNQVSVVKIQQKDKKHKATKRKHNQKSDAGAGRVGVKVNDFGDQNRNKNHFNAQKGKKKTRRGKRKKGNKKTIKKKKIKKKKIIILQAGGGGGGDKVHNFGGILDIDPSHRNKVGPVVSINHFHAPHKNRYALSQDWADSNISAKSRNTSTKNKLKRAHGNYRGDWYRRNVASKVMDRNKEYIASGHSRLRKYNRENTHIQNVLKYYGF